MIEDNNMMRLKTENDEYQLTENENNENNEKPNIISVINVQINEINLLEATNEITENILDFYL